MTTNLVKCSALNKAGEPCKSTSVGADGLCAAHGGRITKFTREHAVAGAKAAAARKRERSLGVQERLARAVEADAQAILAAYKRGLRSSDERIALASAESLLTRVFGRPTERVETVDTAELARLTNLTEAQLLKLRSELEADNVVPLPKAAGGEGQQG